jgi:glyoxylase-like metal-dependent hydrolase (beta-lactamase superfamily II)
VPGAPGWRWIPTPGHSPGHISLLRDSDRTIVAGDAFTTTKQESLVAALTQRAEIHGPPMYFTPTGIARARR